MTHLGDITKINWFTVPPVDVVTGGSPLQRVYRMLRMRNMVWA